MTPEQFAKLQELLKKFNSKDGSLSELQIVMMTKMLEAQDKMKSINTEVEGFQKQINDLSNNINEKQKQFATEQGKSVALLDVLLNS